ncbi:hypothetical protein HQ533_00725 [Candidatus Woesearchaeota archaeon]|nr:hypothetical protein [Candidatus Woesearchaeota archaeon]
MNKILLIKNKLKYPAIYASSFATLTGITESVTTGGNLETAVDTAITNLPFFSIVNLGYGLAVEYTTKKIGRVGANILCLGVNAAFGGYAYITGDSDPTYQTLASTIVGLYLTNRQVTSLQ